MISEQGPDGGGDEQRVESVREEGGVAPPPLRLLPARGQGRRRGARQAGPRHLPQAWLPDGYSQILDRMCLALRASGLWLRYTTLQNLIPSFPWIAPGWRV